MLKSIIYTFFKGMGDSMYLMLPYFIKNPYKDEGNSLTGDWYYCSSDIRKCFNKIKKENVSEFKKKKK